MKRIIFDVGHPAQVHQYKHVFWLLREKGWEGLFTVKDKEVAIELLMQYKLPYKIVGTNKKGFINKILSVPLNCIKFFQITWKFRPSIVLSRSSLHSSWVSWLLSIKHIAFADTEHTKVFDKMTFPFIGNILTPACYEREIGRKQIRFSGNIELFYLHPNRFIPDSSIKSILNIGHDDKYVIVRFISWNAHHDVGEKGLSNKTKTDLIFLLSKYMKVFISSENLLPNELQKYQIKISPDRMHDALYFASLYIGEGATMASEAAVLGTPAIYINTLPLGYVKEEANAGLAFIFKSELGLLEKTEELINSDINFKNRRTVFLKDKIDPTAFLIWFIENYPQSAKIMKENPNYQYNFK